MASNVYEVFQAAINDDPCGHGHKTFKAAMDCARKTVRAAKRGKKFYNSDVAAKLNPKDEDQIAMCVKRHLVAR